MHQIKETNHRKKQNIIVSCFYQRLHFILCSQQTKINTLKQMMMKLSPRKTYILLPIHHSGQSPATTLFFLITFSSLLFGEIKMGNCVRTPPLSTIIPRWVVQTGKLVPLPFGIHYIWGIINDSLSKWLFQDFYLSKKIIPSIHHLEPRQDTCKNTFIFTILRIFSFIH